MEDMVKDLGKMAIDEGLKSLPGGAIISKFVTGGNDAAPKDNSSKILEKLLDAEVKNIKELISVGNNLAETKYTVSGIQTTLNSTKETLEKQISQNYNNLNQRTEQLAEKTFSTIQNLGSSLTDSLDQTNQKFHRDLNTQAETLSRSWESKIKENSKKFEENLNEVKKAGAEALINKSKETIEVQNKINKDILKISKEAFQNSASLNDVKIYDLPKLYDDIYKIQNKICEEENIKKMTQNRAESRITELERKLQTLNEKYMALLEDNIKIQSELHEISLQQITAPTNFAPNFYRQRQNSEDEYSEIDNINEEFTNAE